MKLTFVFSVDFTSPFLKLLSSAAWNWYPSAPEISFHFILAKGISVNLAKLLTTGASGDIGLKLTVDGAPADFIKFTILLYCFLLLA